MSGIFISYRREDSADVTGRIHDRLAQHFDQDRIFIDVDSIPLGLNFARYIDEQVGKCQIFLAVVGRDWLSVTDERGQSRLQSSDDFVRLEIESALRRDIPVIPLLVGGAEMPKTEDLPETLAELAKRNGTLIRPNPDFHRDMDRLIKGIEQHLEQLAEAEVQRKAEEEKRTQADLKAKQQEEKEERRKVAAEAKRKADEEQRRRTTADAERKAEKKERKQKRREERDRLVKQLADIDIEVEETQDGGRGYEFTFPVETKKRLLSDVANEFGALQPVKSIDLSHSGVGDSSMSVLARFEKLQTLDLAGTKVKDIRPLASIPNLRVLNLNSTRVTDLRPLSGLTRLKELYRSVLDTEISDLSPLAELKNLQKLDLGRCEAEELAPLAALTDLQSLRLSHAAADLSPLAGLTHLRKLDLPRCKAKDLTPLSTLTRLESLNLSRAEAADLSTLPRLANLRELDLSFSKDTGLRFCERALEVAKSRKLDPRSLRATDPPPQNPFVNLQKPGLDSLTATESRELGLGSLKTTDPPPRNPFANLQKPGPDSLTTTRFSLLRSAPELHNVFPQLTRLRKLNLAYSRVALSALTALSALEELNLRDMKLADLSPLAKLTNLKTLLLGRTRSSRAPEGDPRLASSASEFQSVKDLEPIARLTRLKKLDIRGTQVEDLSPLAELPALELLVVNSARSLDLTPLKHKPRLRIVRNPLDF